MLDDSLASVFRELYAPHKLHNRSEGQRRNYTFALRHFELFLGRPPRLGDLTDGNIAGLLRWIVELPRAPRTANKTRDCLLALWRFLARKRVVEQWPDVEPMIEPELIPRAWLKHELQAMFAAVQKQPGEIGRVPAALWWNGLLSLLWDSAERIRPIWLLEWRDVDMQNRHVDWQARNRKGGRKANQSKLHVDTVRVLRELRRYGRDGFVLPRDFSYCTLFGRFKRVLRDAQLPSDRSCMFHRIRKSAASWFEAGGGNATELLGHSSRQVTRAYLDQRIVGKQHAVDLLFRPGEKHS